MGADPTMAYRLQPRQALTMKNSSDNDESSTRVGYVFKDVVVERLRTWGNDFEIFGEGAGQLIVRLRTSSIRSAVFEQIRTVTVAGKTAEGVTQIELHDESRPDCIWRSKISHGRRMGWGAMQAGVVRAWLQWGVLNLTSV